MSFMRTFARGVCLSTALLVAAQLAAEDLAAGRVPAPRLASKSHYLVDFTTKKAGSDQATATTAPSANGEIDQANKDATDKGTSKDSKSETKAGEGSKIKVAAAIGVTVLDSRSTAQVEDGAVVKAGGAIRISSTSEVDASTKAIGFSLSQGGSDEGGDGGGGGGGGCRGVR